MKLDDLKALFFIAQRPLKTQELADFFEKSKSEIHSLLKELASELANTSEVLELRSSGAGWRYYLKKPFLDLAHRFWAMKPTKISKSTLEILALIAYHQPLTRMEIEQLRGASLNTQSMKLLLDLEWIEIAGYKNLPGKPALFQTTDLFLEAFGLASIEDWKEKCGLAEDFKLTAF